MEFCLIFILLDRGVTLSAIVSFFMSFFWYF